MLSLTPKNLRRMHECHPNPRVLLLDVFFFNSIVCSHSIPPFQSSDVHMVYTISGPRSLVPGPWSQVFDPGSLVPGPWSWVLGPRSLVSGPWSQVLGPGSLVPGPWSLVPGPRSQVLGPRSLVPGLWVHWI